MQIISADFIFNGSHFLPQHTAIVLDESGTIKDVISNCKNENKKHYNGLIMPGLINTHCHLELSHLQNLIQEKTGLVDFLISINDLRMNRNQMDQISAMYRADENMHQQGIVAVGDISNTIDSLLVKQKSKIKYYTFVECVGLVDADANERFQASKNIYTRFQADHPSSLVLHAPYSVSKTLTKLVDTHNSKIQSIHNQECEDENRLFLTGEGKFHQLFENVLHKKFDFLSKNKTSIRSYLPTFLSNENLILVHNTFTDIADFQWANQLHQNLFWCTCPHANLYIENKLPDIKMWQDNNAQITIGTDSLASNNDLSILKEISLLQQHVQNISLENMLKWGTLNGAKALQMDSQLGSLEIGKKPGIVSLENFEDKNKLPVNPTIKWIASA